MYISNQQIRDHLQAQVDATHANHVLELMPGEYPGPIYIRKPITIDGQRATLWALRGPVLVIEGKVQVEIRNLRVEVTDDTPSKDDLTDTAIQIAKESHVEFDDVEVRGGISGLAVENGTWRYPKTLYLGHLAPMHENEFRLRISAAAPCKLTSEVSGIAISPSTLPQGPCEITLRVEKMRRDTLLLGRILIKTAFCKRWFILNGQVGDSHATSKNSNGLLWEPADWNTLNNSPNPGDVLITAELVEPAAQPKSNAPESAAPTPSVAGPVATSPFVVPQKTESPQPRVFIPVAESHGSSPIANSALRTSFPVRPSSPLFKVQAANVLPEEQPPSKEDNQVEAKANSQVASESIEQGTAQVPVEEGSTAKATDSSTGPKLKPPSKFFKKD